MKTDKAWFVEVQADVRYWEDGEINGEEDTEGKIPLRCNDSWCPVIALVDGQIQDWPSGVTARVHYKVCDAGEYWLLNEEGKRIAKWKGSYVPDKILTVGNKGYGDYIIFSIDSNGKIIGWRPPIIDDDEWK